MKYMRIKSILLFALFASQMAMAQPVFVDGIVGVIGRNIVLKSDWDLQVQSAKQQAQPGFPVPSTCQVLEDLFFEKLLIHQAGIDSVVVSEDEIEGTMDRRIGGLVQQIGSERKLEEYYKKSIIEIKEEMKELVESQLLAQRMQGKISDGIEITPTEVRNYYSKIPQDSLPLINTEVELAQIVIYPNVTAEASQETVDRLKELKERVNTGSSFSTLAILYSEDPGSAKNGGEYKGIKRGQFVKEFEAVAFNMRNGEVSDPFKTEYGYHIVQLITKRGEELDLRHILIKPKISDVDLNKSKAKLDSVRQEILLERTSFDQAAFKVSDDESTRFNNGLMMNPQSGDSKWEVNQLERSLFYSLENLGVGEISKPVLFRTPDGKEGFRLVRLLGKTEPHRANLNDDYSRIQNVALSEKKQLAVEEWIDDKLKDTAVRINMENVDCTFRYKWLKEENNDSK